MISKKSFTLLVFLFALTTTRAQYALIPDTNFRNFLINNGFAGCIVGNSLDTTCTAVITATKINCAQSNIHSIEGVEYFDNLDTLICSGNYYLTFINKIPAGVSYFDCSFCQYLTDLPVLPSLLQHLNCLFDSLTTLPPALPIFLTFLECGSNHLTSLPVLPTLLSTLSCGGNPLTSLPSLPNSLTYLQCVQTSLTSLPVLPPGLDTLICYINTISSLPALPGSLLFLDCYGDSLSSLPALPQNLRYLRCQQNQISVLPSLPDSLKNFNCSFNLLTSLPTLPLYLEELNCSNNQITSLPQLPDPYHFFRLECQNNMLNGSNFSFTISSYASEPFYLNCSNNPLLGNLSVAAPYPHFDFLDCTNCGMNALPSQSTFIDNGYSTLRCDYNSLTLLPPLGTLRKLYCSHNQIASLPNLGVQIAICNNNLITSMGEILNQSINKLNIDSNPIECLPQLFQIDSFFWRNTNIHCLPNYSPLTIAIPSIQNMPLCQPSDTCPALWNITGIVYFDADSNCVQDSSEIPLVNIPVVLDSGGMQLQRFVTDSYGRYSFRTGFGNYIIRIDTNQAPYRVVCPATFSQVSNLTLVDSMDSNINFGLLCNTGFDLTARSITSASFFRPGFQRTIYVDAGDGMSFSGIDCGTAPGGTVNIILDNLVSYVSPAPDGVAPTVISGDTVTWTISDFSLVDPIHDFNIIVQVSTSATINDSICFQLNILPIAGDNIPSNNFLSECYPVRAAFDPNEKYMSPSGLVDTSQQWFEFTIFFQNVGNATAEDIYILDTLDQNLDATTFTYLSSSHDVITQMLPANILRFNYPDINLADSTTDEPASHGFVKFKVKRKENLPVNTTITNTAHIFFDFNAAVVTNTTSATLTTSVGMSEYISPEIILYPNPAESQLTVYLPKDRSAGADSRQYTMSSIEILNSMGQQMYLLKAVKSKRETIGLENFARGIYIVKITLENKIIVERFIKQ
jgi:uncharacterized repeat protein (TIGR01451 family)